MHTAKNNIPDNLIYIPYISTHVIGRMAIFKTGSLKNRLGRIFADHPLDV